MAETAPLKRIIEAALLASTQPLTLPQLSGLFDEFDMPPQDDLARALEELQADCAERGVELVEVASGFRYQVRQDVHAFVSRLWTERPSRYSRALLETLCLIAYRQPITRAEIEQIRGVAVSTNIIRTLEEREWVRVVGYRDLPGKPALFGTTKQFLDYFNLKSLDQLPPLSEIRDIEDLDPQLALDGEHAIPAAVSIDGGDAADTDAEAAADSDGESAGSHAVHAEAAHGDDASTAHAETATVDAHADHAHAADAMTAHVGAAAEETAAPGEPATSGDAPEPSDAADDAASPHDTTARNERADPDTPDTSA